VGFILVVDFEFEAVVYLSVYGLCALVLVLIESIAIILPIDIFFMLLVFID
jgi:hypothetical protein